MTRHFTVQGMSCSGCAQSIVRRLSALPGVEAVTADHVLGSTEVTFDETMVSPEELCRAIEALGFDAQMTEPPVKEQ